MASIFIRTLIIYFLLTISLKIMGKRQIGELEVSELVSTLLVSEVAALPIADPDIPLLNAIIPVLFIVSLEIIISSMKNKNKYIKKFVEGEPTFIIYKGKLRQKALEENRISINEFISELRLQGYADISEVNYAILESNGKISAFGKEDRLAHNIIVENDIKTDVLKSLGYDKKWLKKRLGNEKKKIFLMTVDDNGMTDIIYKDEKDENP